MKPSDPPITPEAAERAREVLNEYDDIVMHDRVLAREQTVGQFMLGALRYTPISGVVVLAGQRMHELVDQGPGIDNKFGIFATALGGALGGLKRIVGRRRDAVKVANFEKARASSNGSTAS